MTLTDAEEGAKDELKVNDSAWLKEDECDGAHRDDYFQVQRMLSGPVDDPFQNCNTWRVKTDDMEYCTDDYNPHSFNVYFIQMCRLYHII